MSRLTPRKVTKRLNDLTCAVAWMEENNLRLWGSKRGLTIHAEVFQALHRADALLACERVADLWRARARIGRARLVAAYRSYTEWRGVYDMECLMEHYRDHGVTEELLLDAEVLQFMRYLHRLKHPR